MRPYGLQMGYDDDLDAPPRKAPTMENGHDLPDRPGEPQVRLRVKHTKSARGGWVCSETTVELVLPLLPEGARAGGALLEGYLQEVHRLGAREARRRNEVDGYG